MAIVGTCKKCGGMTCGQSLPPMFCSECVEKSKNLKDRLVERIRKIKAEVYAGHIVSAYSKLSEFEEYVNSIDDKVSESVVESLYSNMFSKKGNT